MHIYLYSSHNVARQMSYMAVPSWFDFLLYELKWNSFCVL